MCELEVRSARLCLLLAMSMTISPLHAAGHLADDPDFDQAVIAVIRKNPGVVIDAINKYQVDRQFSENSIEWQKAMEAPITLDLRNSPSKGPKDAPFSIVEIADFECHFCAGAQKLLGEILERYAGKVRLSYIHLPLTNHSQSMPAALAAWAAWKQGKFFEYQERLFALDASITPASLLQIADDLKLNRAAFERDRKSPEAIAQIRSDIQQAKRIGVLGTPTFVVNGVPVRGVLTMADFEALIKLSRSASRTAQTGSPAQ